MTFSFPELQRPQYPSSPEVLLSALAWSVVPRSAEHKKTGLIYSRKHSSARRTVVIEQTMPRDSALDDFARALRANGLSSGANGLPRWVAEAAAHSLLGPQPLKGVGVASSAIGLSGALLQDPVGGLAASNPPNFAQLLNTMHVLGGGRGPSAAARWFQAAQSHATDDTLRAIEVALSHTTLRPYLAGDAWPPAAPIEADGARPTQPPAWWVQEVLEEELGTPFSWFRRSWDRLCSPEWYSVLPPRRWAGWAVCVLRNALGFGFLWEANFFFEVARGVVDTARDPRTAAQWALKPTKPLVPYQKGSISQMDVAPSIKQLVTKGLACRKAILAAAETLGGTPATLADFIEEARHAAGAAELEGIRVALAGGGDKAGLKNLLETVRYSLLTRGTPDSPDHSSLLKVVSRNYTHVLPGPEWIVVMSATSTPTPSAILRLGDVRRSLEDIGFKPRIDFLVGELERAGLCASAPDGDEGIEINLGFSRG